MFAVAILLCGISVSAATDVVYEYTVSGDEATITGVVNKNSFSGEQIIPDKLGGYPVTSIGNYAFYNCSGLTSVTIPDNVTSSRRLILMEVGKVCKGTSIILFILDFIGSIVLGNVFAGYEFNWAVFLYGIIAGFIFCLLIYALGEIINQLETSNSNTNEIYHLLKRIASEEEKKTEPKKSYLISSNPTVKKTADGGWICKKCNTKNDSNAQFCKDCGTYK